MTLRYQKCSWKLSIDEISSMVKMNIPKKTQKESMWLIFALIVALIFLVLFIFTIFNNNETDKGYSQIPFAIHALEPALYADELLSARFPGVKLSILWEILYDQNLSPEEVEMRIRKLEEQLSQLIQKDNSNTVAKENEVIDSGGEHPADLLTQIPKPLNATPQSMIVTLSLFGPNPFITSTMISTTSIEHSATSTFTSSITQTLQSTPKYSVTPQFTSSRTLLASLTHTATPTLTGSPTASNTVIWYPTFTNTSFPTHTPIPPSLTPTKTPLPPTLPPTLTPTNTPLPPTLTPTDTPIPPTLTPTLAICNSEANQISVVFHPSNESVNILTDILPIVKFNQAMDTTTFVYGGNDFTIALCEFDNLNVCPPPKVISASLEFIDSIFSNDTVIINPDIPLESGVIYIIIIGNGIYPNPQCVTYSEPISEKIISKFTTIQ